MTELDVLDMIRSIRKGAPEVYRHVVALLQAIAEKLRTN